MHDQFTVDHGIVSLFGIGTHGQTGVKLREMGCRKALLVYDPTIDKLGIAGKVRDAIHAAGIETVCYGAVKEDPTSAIVDEAGFLGRDNQVDCVVGIGGGSSLDAAKGANLLLSNEGSISDYIGVNRGKKPILKKYPLVLLPTTSGTSAEITPVFVVTESATGLKTGARNRGDLAIIDPQFMVNIPPQITAATGFDMLAHVTESYTNPKPNWMSDLMDERVVEIVFRYLPLAYRKGDDLEARERMSFACMVAGYAFADKGTHIGHAVADRVSNALHYPHGVCCALGLPVALRYAAKAWPCKLARLAGPTGTARAAGDSDSAVAHKVVDAYLALKKELGLKTMREMGVDAALLESMVKTMPDDVRFKNNPHAPDFALVEEALREEFASAP